MYPVVFAGEGHAALLRAALPVACVVVTSATELIAEAAKPGAIVFVDCDLLYQIEGEVLYVPIVGILDEPIAKNLPRMVRSLDVFPWLSHLLSVTMLESAFATAHLAMLLERLPCGPPPEQLGASGVGRMALLARASRREARFDRMRDFFAMHGLSVKTIATLTDVAEELVTNALYDAPVEAGFFEQAIPRTEDVSLPPERACEISYGVEDDKLFVRLRDTFGALRRGRLLDVLNRCSTNAVKLDESRGGAGLGLWRIFAAASTITITVIPGSLTDIQVTFATITKGGRLAKQLLAVDLFFVSERTRAAELTDEEHELVDQSITLFQRPDQWQI